MKVTQSESRPMFAKPPLPLLILDSGDACELYIECEAKGISLGGSVNIRTTDDLAQLLDAIEAVWSWRLEATPPPEP